jgi:transcription initiation factor TFIID subunit 9B
MGVEQHDPRVVNMLLNFMYKYVSEVVLDAEAFSEQAGRPPGEVDTEDITLAIQSRTAHYFTQHPPIASQQLMGDRVNSVPLPEFRSDLHGLRYPPEPNNLTNPNWQIQVAEAQYDSRGTPMDTQ